MIVTNWQARHGLSDTDYQHVFNDLSGRGYRLIKAAGHVTGGQPRYSGIWQQRGGNAWQARHGITEPAYQQTMASLGEAGYWPVHVNAFPFGDETRFNAIWEQQAGINWIARHDLTGAEYQALFDALSRRKYRLRSVSGYEVHGEARYACIWNEYAGPAWEARHGIDARTYQETFDTLARRGFRLIQVCGYTIRREPRFTAVWEQSPGHSWQARHGVPEAAYQAEFDTAVQQGLRLVDVSGYASGNSACYTTIWEDGRPDQPSNDPVKAVVVPFMQRWAAPALSVAIARGGAVLATRSFGYANPITRETATPATRFRVASVSKPITSTAIFRLIEQGKLALGDRVFGAGARLGTTFGTTPYGQHVTSITIQHLLEHTAGGWQNDMNDPMFAEPSRSANDLIGWTLDHRPLANAPGTDWKYSNFGYCVLGRVIEAVTGQSYADYVRTNVLAPSGVTTMAVAGDLASERQWPEAIYAGKDLENPYAMKVRRMDAHGGWMATAEDLLRFGLHVDGFIPPADLLQSATIATMMTPCAVHSSYAKGWGVDASGTRQHNGLLTGTTSVLVRRADKHEWAAVCSTGIVGSSMLDEFEALIATIDGLL